MPYGTVLLAVILTYGSRSWKPINYGSGRIQIQPRNFRARWKKSLINSKAPEPQEPDLYFNLFYYGSGRQFNNGSSGSGSATPDTAGAWPSSLLGSSWRGWGWRRRWGRIRWGPGPTARPPHHRYSSHLGPAHNPTEHHFTNHSSYYKLLPINLGLKWIS